jgi:hypothetical protein
MKLTQPVAGAAAWLAAVACACPSASDGLFRLEVAGVAVENGKTLEMSFCETRREPAHSSVEVRFVSGGSVSSSLFILRGLCGLARERGEHHFQALREVASPWRFKVLFRREAGDEQITDAHAAEKVWAFDECAMLRY